ncbi:MAG: molybdopterin molybdotransferase MoeA [Actinomycetota bacterium]|nr:molybdopterin molybdotransferase MoeA [Actinomycetota bacterium]
MSDPVASGVGGLTGTDVAARDDIVAVDAYRDRILADLEPLEPIELRLPDALGLVLAEDVVPSESLPPLRSAAVDGYAVVAADVTEASADQPVRLRVAGQVRAVPGVPPKLQPGTALAIMTGAPVPDGADTVVPAETTHQEGAVVAISVAPPPGSNIRDAGEDITAGTRLIRAGRRLRPGDIAALAALGHAPVRCYPRPRVVILSTGSDLVAPEQSPSPGTIRDSNGPMLAALVRQADAVAFWAGIVADDRRALIDAFDSNIGHADVIVTTGGVRAGAYDRVRDVLAMLGEVHAATVAIEPGGPQLYGRVRGVPVFGLPDQPASGFVSFEVVVRPALRRLQGRRDLSRPTVSARLTDAVVTRPGRRTFLRVRLRQDASGWSASLTGPQGAEAISSLLAADGLAEIPEQRTDVPSGTRVTVHLLVEP